MRIVEEYGLSPEGPIKVGSLEPHIMSEFDIWMEGYVATGESNVAQLIGTGVGETFDDAVINYMSKKKNKHLIERNERNRYVSDEAYNNRRSNWNIWACSLFDNKIDARKSFG